MDTTLKARLPIAVLGDVERFLESAQHLKALRTQLRERRCRASRLELSLERQIDTFTQHCGELAAASPRLAELWTQTQDELRRLDLGTAPPGTGAAPGTGTSPGTGAAPGGTGSSNGHGMPSSGGACSSGTSSARRGGTS